MQKFAGALLAFPGTVLDRERDQGDPFDNVVCDCILWAWLAEWQRNGTGDVLEHQENYYRDTLLPRIEAGGKHQFVADVEKRFGPPMLPGRAEVLPPIEGEVTHGPVDGEG